MQKCRRRRRKNFRYLIENNEKIEKNATEGGEKNFSFRGCTFSWEKIRSPGAGGYYYCTRVKQDKNLGKYLIS